MSVCMTAGSLYLQVSLANDIKGFCPDKASEESRLNVTTPEI